LWSLTTHYIWNNILDFDGRFWRTEVLVILISTDDNH